MIFALGSGENIAVPAEGRLGFNSACLEREGSSLLKSASLKTAYRAAVLSDDTAVFVVTQRRIKRLEISEQLSGLRVRQTWSTAITYGSHVLLSADETILIVTDTSGAHFGLSIANGEILWETKPVGEGDAGALLNDGAFVFVTWDGMIQHLDPKSGQELSPTRKLDRQVRRLHVDSNGLLSLVEYVRSANDALPGTWRLLRMDWPSLNCVIRDSKIDGGKIALSPDGTRIASGGSSNSLQIRSVGNAQTEFKQELPGPAHYNSRPVWSADSKLIAVAIEYGHSIFSVESIEVISLSNSPYPEPASFSRSAVFVVLCDWSDAKIVKLSRMIRPQGLLSDH